MKYGNIVQSWYPLAKSRSLKPGTAIDVEPFGRRLILFRTRRGKLGLIERNCTHMGGDLKRGTVTESGIQCPIHNWEFAPSGQVVGDNALGLSNQRRPCQSSIVCDEVYGIVHGYFGNAPAFTLPRASVAVFSSAVETIDVNLRYDIPSVFGFDSEHFETVHKRGIDTLTVYRNHKAHLGTHILASVDGQRMGDRIMRSLGMHSIQVDVDFWAANIIFGEHLHSNTFVLVSGIPIGEHATRLYITVLQARPSGGLVRQLLGRLRFAIAKPVTRAFLKQDEQALTGVRFDRESPYMAQNSSVHAWLDHYDSLPRLSDWREDYQ